MTPVLQVENLTKSFGVLTLFRGISFGLAEGQKVGLIARNGSGKSTLMNILAGHENYDEGKITFRNDLRIGYLPQTPQFPEGINVLDACFNNGGDVARLVKQYEQCLSTEGNPGLDELLTRMDQLKAWNYEQQAKQILTQLKITDYGQKVSQLSGGQVKRLALANVLINEPQLLMLDEPTNHLDLDMIEWLEDYLRRSTLTLLMVTHDRYFLDRACSDILELDNQTIYSYHGNYAYYLDKRQERIDAKNAEIAHARNLYRTELDWMRRMPQARGHKAKYREDAFYELQKVAKQHVHTDNVRLNVKSAYIGNKIFEAEHVCKSFGNIKILDDFSYTFSRYEKMGIIGNNGTGKSTFLKILLGQLQPDSGTIEVGQTVRFGYYSQEGMKFNDQMKVIDAVRDIAEVVDMGDGSRLTATQFLQHFLFPPEKQYNFIYKLSGGERRRLYLCTVLMRSPNFLVLDEPTNDLDIVTLQVLEDYLQNFGGCVIVVSHDRFFMDKVVDHLLVFNGQGDIRDFPGNYTQYREWKEEKRQHDNELARQQKQAEPSAQKTARIRLNDKRRMTFKERQEFQQLEQDIGRLEAQKKQIEEALCSGKLSVDELTEQSKLLPQITVELDVKSMRWLELSELE